MHNTNCCTDGINIAISFCSLSNHYRVRGQWCPSQMSIFEDAVHDVEICVDRPEEIRGAIVQVYREFHVLLRLSAARATHHLATVS